MLHSWGVVAQRDRRHPERCNRDPSLTDKITGSITICRIAAWPMTFGLQSCALAAQRGEAIAFGPARMLNRFQLPEPGAWALLDPCLVGLPGRHAAAADAGAALAWLTEQGVGPPGFWSEAQRS
jgi:hypothetical protein